MKIVFSLLVIFVTTGLAYSACTIENVIISLEIEEDSVFVSWTYDTTCPSTIYVITHFIGGTEVYYNVSNSNGVELQKITCSVNEVKLTIRTVEGVIVHVTKSFDVGQYNPVQDLVFVDGRFEWSPPIDSASCSITYDVLLETKVEAQEFNVKENYFEFDFRPCANKITVTPVVLEISGPSAQFEHIVIPTNLGPVEDLQFNSDRERFEWNRPKNTESCTVTYDIMFENESEIKDFHDIEENHFTFDQYPCTLSRIKVIPFVLETAAPAAESEYTVPLKFLGPVRELLYNSGRFEWKPPNDIGICTVTYDVNFQNTIANISENGIELNYFEFDLDPCNTNTIEITAVSEELRGQLETMTHSMDIAISNLILSQNNLVLSATWNTPEGTEECDLVYRLRMSNNANTNVVIATSNETSFIFNGTIVPCSTVEVIVTAIGTAVGSDATASLTAIASQQSAPVLNNMMTSCYTTEMVWTGQDYEDNMCEVTHFQMWCASIAHNVTTRQDIEERFDRTFDIFLSDLQPDTYYTCIGYIFVTLVGFSPPSLSVEFKTNLESVNNFTLQEIDGMLSASWTPPFDYEECLVAYEVSIENELVSETFQTSELQHTFDEGLVPCTTTVITVTPVSYTGSHGASVSQTFSPEIDVGSVRNLQMGNNTIQWLAPLNSGRCLVTYDGRHVGPQGEVHFYGIEETIIEVIMAPCSLQTVEVRPVVDIFVGPTSTLTNVISSSDHAAPLHVLTIPEYTSAHILVKGEAFELNECTISNAVVECWYESGNITEVNLAIVDDEEERLFLLRVDTLIPNTMYTCRARWDSSDFGEHFSFRTAPTNLASTIGNNNFSISWVQEYGGSDLILRYVLVIESTGPMHYVPDRCDIERSGTYVIEIPANTTTYNFATAFPNYRYNVQLITVYSFGEFESANLTVDTLPSIPGTPEDLNILWIYEKVEAYSVNGSVAWWMPCDTHGDLQYFIVRVASIFTINDQEQTQVALSVVDANSPISDVEYSLALNNVNPMFTYIVSVMTVAAAEGSVKNLTVTPPPACRCT